MQVNIKVLNIGNADAIIICLKKTDHTTVFLIDGGRERNSELVLTELKSVLDETSKDAPDFLLCTHYDDDHIGGLFPIVKKYGKLIGKVWLHKTSEKLDKSALDKELVSKRSEGIFPSETDSYLTSEGGNDVSYYQEVIQDLKQEIKFIELLSQLDIPIEEPTAENFKVQDWPELSVICPTETLYKELFPDKFNSEELIREEVESLKDEKSAPDTKTIITDPNKALDGVTRTKLTATNLNSAALMLTIDKTKFLFAADVGIQSLEAIPEYKTILSDIFWLKVPHHGSKNNINSALINLMKPNYAIISGGSLVSDEVIKCFQHVGSKVMITRDNNHIEFNEEIK